jgi:hypothetical protein
VKDKFGIVVEKRERLAEEDITGDSLIQYKIIFLVDLNEENENSFEQPTLVTIRSCDKEFYDQFEVNKKYSMTFALKNTEPRIIPKKKDVQ